MQQLVKLTLSADEETGIQLAEKKLRRKKKIILVYLNYLKN